MLVKAREKFWTPQSIAPYYKVTGGGGGSVTFTKTDRVSRNTNGTSDSFSITIGTGTVIIVTSYAVAPTSITLNGNAMTKRIATTSGANGTDQQIWSLVGQTAGVATLAISAAFLPTAWQAAAGVLTNASASPGTGVIQNEVIGAGGTTLALGPLNIPTGGIAIVTWNDSSGAAGGTDPNGNLTIDYNTSSATLLLGLAHTTTATGSSVPIGIGTPGTNVYAGVSLPWGP